MFIRDKPCQYAVMLSGCLLVAFGSLSNCSQCLRKLWQLGLPFSPQSCHSKLGVRLSCMAKALSGCEKLALTSVNLHALFGDAAPVFNTSSLVRLTAPLGILRKMIITYISYKEKSKVHTTQVNSIATGTLWSLRHI